MSASASASTAYLLISHGSRDPRPGQGMERLAQFVRSPEGDLWGRLPDIKAGLDHRLDAAKRLTVAGQSLRRAMPTDWLCTDGDTPISAKSIIFRSQLSQLDSAPLVGTACLELGAVPLHQQIARFSRRAQAAGAQRIRLVPLFLLAGVHVLDDIPAEVNRAQQLVPDLTLEVCSHLGSHPGIKGVLRHKLRTAVSETLILLGHGSRRPGGNATVSALARSLGGTAAFWAVAPNLESQVIHHLQSGVQRVAILPYFLFTGRTTDAITHLTEELAERFPSMGFHLLPPLGPSPELARLVVDLALGRVPAKAQQAAAPMQRVAFRHTIRSSSMVS
ncbi:sirohydrochlorin chelatase [Nodosilinea sp. LEGE 07088]|uniref:sirohydrochlorin chelatase n=1 Tax=Nodosilinea sp. LEGE 07088 TaxID=2777968 RepID=UPI0018812DA4|nr:sirohydrochlorin chelatase [Nodosilinea sp. LEGE 07088]MBE9136272.1 sirohydrochlorin chelatase [Nodosilinea sp. LEGE 07088]